MERKGSRLRRMQDELFSEAWKMQSYYEVFQHNQNDRDYTLQQLAIYEELSYLISHMGWIADYIEYCKNNSNPYGI